MEHLSVGTILDERYQITGTLGEGGFGITYAAENIRIGTRVAVKEFFWRGYVKRNEETQELEILKEVNAESYETLKGKFLQEARILKDFENEPSIVHILDYFEGNNTAYMVMEYLDGQTLRRYNKQNTPFDAETLFRKMLPLVKSLGQIHRQGIIHRDISPDNIMVLKNGSFKLLDFGAARKYGDVAGGQYTTIARDSYAPPEQYDRNGAQGPWTDVYALCATLYECLANVPPDSAVQRMFLDELKTLSAAGADIDKEYEAIIMKGLSMKPERRQQSMDEFSAEIEEALPAEAEIVSSGKKWLKILIPVAAAAAVVIGIIAYRRYDETHKFRDVETEEFILYAPEEMTAAQFQISQKALDQELSAFAGKDNYECTVDGTAIHVRLPLSCFADQEIAGVIEERFAPLANANAEDAGEESAALPGNSIEANQLPAEQPEDSVFSFEYEIKANWEDAGTSILAGENQCAPEDLDGMTVTQVYSGSDSGQTMSKGEWSNVVTDIKVRLDTLDTPYAFGTLYGNDRKIVIRMDPARIGGAVNSTLGLDVMYHLEGEHSITSGTYIDKNTAELSVKEQADGTCCLTVHYIEGAYAAQENRLQTITENLTGFGEGRLYLKIGEDCVAGAELAGPVTDNAVTFDEFYIGGGRQITKEDRYILDYFRTVLNDTSIPYNYRFESRNFRDENGGLLFGFDGRTVYGWNASANPLEEELTALAEQLQADGYDASANTGNGILWINLHCPAAADFGEEALWKIKNLLETYDFAGTWGDEFFIMTEETDKTRARVVASDIYSADAAYGDQKLVLYFIEDGIPKYTEDMLEYWYAFSVDGYVTDEAYTQW